jgi:protein-tyrosine phosphatase
MPPAREARESPDANASDRLDVLVVCTGNICRSPMGEALLREHLRRRNFDANVHSAGTMHWGGPATDHTVEVLHELGIDARAHRSRALSRKLVRHADLVLAMTRNHMWAVTNHDPAAEDRTFMVGEIVRLGEKVGARRADEPVRDWVARVAAARPPGAVMGLATDEVADPVNEPVEVYRSTAVRLDAQLAALAALLVPDVDHH